MQTLITYFRIVSRVDSSCESRDVHKVELIGQSCQSLLQIDVEDLLSFEDVEVAQDHVRDITLRNVSGRWRGVGEETIRKTHSLNPNQICRWNIHCL